MKGQSALEYLMTYGWMLLVVAIVGGAIYTTVSDSPGDRPEKINATEVANYLEERTPYQDCTAERRDYNEKKADATCTRPLGQKGNMSYASGKHFTAVLKNGTITFYTDYNY